MLFRMDPELAHRLTLSLIRIVGGIPPLNGLVRKRFPTLDHPVQAFGLKFANPVGLAAGYDKDGLGWRGLASLGFGHIEVGTVTPKAQPGNHRPRLFRLPEDRALINRMGFPGMGAEFVLRQISKPRPKGMILGVNIGKNKVTPVELAIQDYLYLLRTFSNHADYLAINVSSPNTVGLRQLQERQQLDRLLRQLSIERQRIRESTGSKTPVLVKLAPDLTDKQLDGALEAIETNHMDGVIATNTTIARKGIMSTLAEEAGGLSGMPLHAQSLSFVRKITKRTSGKLPIIGVGGISDATGVQKMLDAGAVLVQIYTALVYEGPGLISRILSELKTLQ